MPTVSTVPRRRLSAGARKRQIVETVLDLVAERGADAVTTQAIAEAVGVSQPAIFRHFPTKEAIWIAVLTWLDDTLTAIHRKSDAVAEADPVDVLERMFLAHVRLIGRRQALAKLVFSDNLRLQYPRLNERFAQIHQAYHQRVVNLIRRAKTQGDVATQLPLKQAATLYFCMVQGLGFQMAIARLPINPEQEARHLFTLYRRAIMVREIRMQKMRASQ